MVLALICALLMPADAGAANSLAGKPCAHAKAVRSVAAVRYVCTKSAGKLVWRVSAALKPATFAAQQRDVAALGNFASPLVPTGYLDIRRAIDAQPEPNTANLQFIVDPDIPAAAVDVVNAKIKLVIRIYASTTPALTMPIRIYFYNTKNFATLDRLLRADLSDEALEGGWLDVKLQRALAEPDGFYGGGSAGYGKDGVPVLFYYLNKHSLTAYDIKQAFAHEFVHVYQRQIVKNMAPMTCWIREGQATCLGYGLAADAVADFRDAWLAQYTWVRTDPSVGDFFGKSESDWLAWLVAQETRPPTDCDQFSNYLYGSIVWSYLYGTYGADRTNTFFATIAQYPMPTSPPGDAWKRAFTSVFGEAPAAVYPRIAKYLRAEAAWVNTVVP